MTSNPSSDRIVELSNQEPGSLTGYDCPKCLNRGYSFRRKETGEIVSVECDCMKIRRSMEYLRKSGLADMASRYTFAAWKTKEQWQKDVLAGAQRFAEKPDGWFYIAGRPGTGKTHVCTAVCDALIKKCMATRYMLWRDFAVTAKASANDAEAYAEIVEPYKKCRVLYIDDFFKTGKGNEPTVGDVNLAFELLNSRYNDERKITILSSEMTIKDILGIDEAIGSRIWERSKRNYIDLSDKGNYRLRGAKGKNE